jgi:predicted ATPase
MHSLQAAARLCRLELAESTGDRYCQALRQLYGSFTEGFSTADLVEAKTLLDKLE